jgi:hypothetical protein
MLIIATVSRPALSLASVVVLLAALRSSGGSRGTSGRCSGQKAAAAESQFSLPGEWPKSRKHKGQNNMNHLSRNLS